MSAVPQSLELAHGRAAPGQRDTTALLLCLGLLLLLYRQTAGSMLDIWRRSDTFAHGILVLPIAVWLVWRKRHGLAWQMRQPAPACLLLVALVGVAWLLAELAVVNTVAQAALVALLVLAVVVLWGLPFARSIAFPLAFLFFAVPVGEFMLPQLMDWTANVTVFALRASGIPVLHAGNSFVIPSGSWSVVEACSGVRYLIASFMLGTLFAYLSYRSLHKRLLFAAASLLVPVLANWMRAYLIVMLGHLSGNRLATGVDHVLYGWLFFGLVMGLMFVLGARWAEPQGVAPELAAAWWTQPQVLPQHPLPTHPPAALPQADGTALWASACGLVLIAALPHLALWAMDRHADVLAATQATASPAVAGPELGPRWALEGVTQPLLVPAYQNPSRLWQGAYVQPENPGQRVGLYIAQYLQQTRGHTLVGSGNTLLISNDTHWSLAAHGSQALELGGQSVTLRTSSLRAVHLLDSAEQGGLQVWQLYWIHGQVTASDFLAKVYSAYARLTGLRDDAAVLLVYAPSEAAVAAFWRDNYGALDAWLLQQEPTEPQEQHKDAP